MQIVIDRQWDGAPATAGERIELQLHADPDGHLRLELDAPFHADPAPEVPPGHAPDLWNFEVVELFLFARDGHYLELELGPHGHFLLLRLHGVRTIVDATVPLLEFRCEPPTAGRWRAAARIDAATIPREIARWNAHAIHGQHPARRYLSAIPASGPHPDFHQPEVSAPLDPTLLRALHGPAIREQR